MKDFIPNIRLVLKSPFAWSIIAFAIMTLYTAIHNFDKHDILNGILFSAITVTVFGGVVATCKTPDRRNILWALFAGVVALCASIASVAADRAPFLHLPLIIICTIAGADAIRRLYHLNHEKLSLGKS